MREVHINKMIGSALQDEMDVRARVAVDLQEGRAFTPDMATVLLQVQLNAELWRRVEAAAKQRDTDAGQAVQEVRGWCMDTLVYGEVGSTDGFAREFAQERRVVMQQFLQETQMI